MHLTILGSGMYSPDIDRKGSGYLVKIGDENLVFDFGRGVIDGLMRSGVNYYNVDYIFITHTHADHCSNLIDFLHISLVEMPGFEFRKKDLVIYGPKGFKKTYDHLLEAFGLEKHKPKHKIIVKEIEDGDVIHGDNWKVQCFKVVHSCKSECLAYRIEADNKVLAYSGDSEDCPGLRKACENADVAVIESSMSNEFKQMIIDSGVEITGHLTAGETGKIAHECNVKKLVMTHIAAHMVEKYNLEDEAKEFFKGEKLIAKDLMKMTI